MKKLIFCALVSVFLISCEDIEDATRKAEDMTLQEKLALLDSKSLPDTNDIKVIRIKYLLAELSERFGEPKDSIADYTSRIQGVLHDQGIEETNLNILEEVNRMGKLENTKYRDAVVVYAMLRSN